MWNHQNIRKDYDFEVTDKIEVNVEKNNKIDVYLIYVLLRKIFQQRHQRLGHQQRDQHGVDVLRRSNCQHRLSSPELSTTSVKFVRVQILFSPLQLPLNSAKFSRPIVKIGEVRSNGRQLGLRSLQQP